MDNLLVLATQKYVALDEFQLNLFEKLTAIMNDANKNMNITAILDDVDIILKHYADSLSLLSTGLITPTKKLCDIGCGGGFPGLPIKIAMPHIYINMIDSTEKKINYIKSTANELGLSKIDFTAARAEDLSREGAMHREKYDLATARAVARLSVLCELCLPFVKVGGHFLAMKGMRAKEEISEAEIAISKLGGKLLEVKQIKFDIPGNDIRIKNFNSSERYIIVIEKVSRCPPSYPRQYAKILKSPID